MTHRHAPSLLALSTLLLCTGSSSSSASSEVRNSSHGDPSAKTKHVTGPSHDSNSTFVSEGGGPGPDEGVSPVCAYRVTEGGISGQLCFRRTLFGYKCVPEDCRTQVSLGTLVANVLTNGSVLLQWTHEWDSKQTKPPGAGPGPTRSSGVFRDRSHRRGGGYELSCRWNGSYTQFECASVHLGSGCRDFLLSELHENIPYRICLRALTRSEPDQRPAADCVEFTLPTSGMQDVVIAMTTVGGAICVMLVIICLLVAYITENIMSPAAKHTHYRSHPRH